MSKYYKKEDVISFLNTHCSKDMWEYQIADLPTIEVSEDCISRADLMKELRKDAERVEIEEFACDTVWRTISNAPSVVPTVRKTRTTAEPQTYITEDRDTQILDKYTIEI